MKPDLAQVPPAQTLTTARLGLGRVSASTPTLAVLDFNMDHAHARDAIHTILPVDDLTQKLNQSGFEVLQAESQAQNRIEYLRRPDLGRSVTTESRARLQQQSPHQNLLTIIIADGLSAQAPTLHALPLLEVLRHDLTGWTLDSIILATQARVALSDEIAQLRGAEAAIILIGERPGLKSFDSLGAYLTYHPEVGLTDADRNCVSNIRAAGLSYQEAAATLIHLLNGARTLGRSGVSLKDSDEHTALAARTNQQLPLL